MQTLRLDLVDDLAIKQGVSYSLMINLGVDLTGAVLASQLRDSHLALNLTLFAITVGSAPLGPVFLTLSAAQTANLAPGRYVWDLLISFPSGLVWSPREGVAIVRATATRSDGLEIIPLVPGVFQTMVVHLGQPNPHPQYLLANQSAETDAALIVGQPLHLKPNGHLDLAIATSPLRVCGLATAQTLPTFAANYFSYGAVSRSDWSLVAGSVSLLVGSSYYLSADTPGKITAISPTTLGQFVVCVGVAISAQLLLIEIQSSILL